MMNHEHMVVRAELNFHLLNTGCHKDLLQNSLTELVSDLGMEIAIGPHLWYCEDAGNEGWTAFCIITTSHIAIHVWDQVVQFDVYTCGDLTMEPIVAFFEKLGGTSKLEYKWIDRSTNLKLVKEECYVKSDVVAA